MNTTGVCSNSCNATKTDLTLLLECLKFQMKCPDLQKQALLTIHSICEKREDNVDLLRDMGGVAFVYNLSKSSIVHPDVKETALFTLGTLAEANVYCKSSLCRRETFADLAGWLLKEDVPLTLKRVTVYLLFVLVANNKSGQTLAQNSGCLDILLDLFRTHFPFSNEATLKAANATHQLWASVSSALCGCVNNPQNEDGQRLCVAAFSIIKTWLQQISLPRTEIFQPICSFIAMTVANNSCVQESFSTSGGLETLTLALVRLASAADTSLLLCQLSVITSKALSACITENSALASGLAQYGVVSHLLSLLVSPHMDPKDRLSVLLTLGHCTEASEEHQFQLVQCGGLPVIITLLAEDTCEEVRKAATFILQTCKQATTCSGVGGLIEKQIENVEPPSNIEGFRRSARELLHRIELLEKTQGEQEDSPHSTEKRGLLSLPPALPLLPQRKEAIETVPMLNPQEEKADSSGGDLWWSVCKDTGNLTSYHVQSLEGGGEQRTANSQFFKLPLPVRHTKPKDSKYTERLEGSEMSKVGRNPVEEHSVSHSRCAGCVLSFEDVTSRTFASLQSSCYHSCDMHKVLREAMEKFRVRHCNLVFRKEQQDNTVEQTDANTETLSAAEPQKNCKNWSKDVCLTPISKGARNGKSFQPQHFWKKYNGFTLAPLRIRGKEETFIPYNSTGPRLTPLRRQRLPEGRRKGNNSGHCALDDQPKMSTDQCSTRRNRKDFSREEVCYLLSGVKRFGFSWNSILWSYPFQPGRSNVDLAKKYRRLMCGEAQDTGSE
ncbi:telomere repeats-binding bouquet formation protein 1 isoform X1 [Brachyistius frenatus]|uniref:telomere repeats-binding bouquet formation protein 1 isoform X1 n=1 Tax=Brachyistius frenatus TaxID=100188 RepID=UPI0037E9A438